MSWGDAWGSAWGDSFGTGEQVAPFLEAPYYGHGAIGGKDVEARAPITPSMPVDTMRLPEAPKTQPIAVTKTMDAEIAQFMSRILERQVLEDEEDEDLLLLA